MNTVDILGYSVSSDGAKADVSAAMAFLNAERRPRFVACANPHSLAVAFRDKEFEIALKGADLLLPDGAGIVLGSRILRRKVTERVTGTEFFEGLLCALQGRSSGRVFFLGSTMNVLEGIQSRLDREYPSIECCGTYSPPFADQFSTEEDAEIVARINAANVDVLWVGMTAPKQEKWIYRNLHQLKVDLAVAIGAVFDFYAGTKERSPVWAQESGLEWLPRLVREPKRLWRRTFISAPRFVGATVLQRLREQAMSIRE